MHKLNLRSKTALLSASFALGFAPLSADATTGISGVPTAWRLENYPSNGVYLWYTPSACSNGSLTLPMPTEGDKNRLFALVLTAKVTNRPIFIYYDENQPSCPIVSFGMDG